MARHDTRVVFVRHALPGERVVAEVTEVGRKGRFLRAEVRQVVVASPERVEPACPVAGQCGGCDWQHASLPEQRRLKAAVVTEQLQRLAGLSVPVVVEPVSGDDGGLHWRTRVRYAVDTAGRPSLRRHRSHDLVPAGKCPLVHPAVRAATQSVSEWVPGTEVEVVGSAGTGQIAVTVVGEPPLPVVESAAGRRWQVTGGFWQAHPGAADALVAVVLDQLQPRPGEHALDLYCGVGLFAGPLAEATGPGGRVDAVEADPQACLDAGHNLADLPTVVVHRSPVLRHLRTCGLRRADVVVLDPPRTGAGREVVEQLAGLDPRAVSYVACDPAALARDVATFAGHGYRLAAVRAFDTFPMTHHVEVVALLVPEGFA